MRSRPSTEEAGSRLAEFVAHCESATGERFATAAEFDRFAVERYREFWGLFLEWSDPPREGDPEPVCRGDDCESAVFFPGLRLNYAECLLDGGADGEIALIARGADGAGSRLDRAELRERARRLAAHLRSHGIEAGDRVAAIAANGPEVIVAALAAATLGATFSCAAPEMGAPAILSRFEQLQPKLLVANLEAAAAPPGLAERVAEVAAGLPSLGAVLALDDGAAPPSLGAPLLRLPELLETEPESPLAPGWERFPFNHPLFILFTSGTTGAPKCIVHGAGGTLLEHLKEQQLHLDLGPGEVLFFHTSTAWMMWNWQLSALATGAAVVVFDGAVTGPQTLWEVVAEEGVTVFGTSPPYLQLCEDAGYSPRRQAPAPALRSVLSTGSVLREWQFDWVAENVGPVKLQSISGGTDIVGCFVLGHPELPVRRGMIQSRSLGLDVQALPTEKTPSDSPVGELICRNPFPSRPLGFLGDDGSRFHDAYFSQNEGVWTHGDLIEFDADGQARIHGRSDGVLNVQGVRIGPAEIYAALHAVPEVAESMAVGQAHEGSTRVVLLVVLAEGAAPSPRLEQEIRRAISNHATALHAPQLIVPVEQLPVTHSGKRSERAGRAAVEGTVAGNEKALANPESLAQIREATLAAEAAQVALAPVATGASVEERLRAIWEELLGLRALGSEDDFFELGGTSLVAVELFLLVEDRFGVLLPPSALLEAPTIAELAATIEDPSRLDTALVRMKDGGSARPLFLVHSISGDVLGARDIATAIAADLPVLGIRAYGPWADEEPTRSIEELAVRYLEVVRGAQPAGPYRIAGHSFGALVAFEMASRLRASGERVEWLGMIDGELSSRCHTPARRWGHRLALPFHYARAVARDPRSAVRAAQVLLRRLFSRGHTVEIEGAPAGKPDLSAAYLQAAYEYCPGPYDGPMTYFLPTVRRFHVFADPMPVWRRLTSERIDVVRVPGPHVGMVNGESARVIAAKIDADLGARSDRD